ncbi:MAG: DUF4058 family protein [bacterium]|nr:DUF4058 family protein [bacterium]
MPLHFPDNRYPGVNAHLNSFLLQPDGGWESFHAHFMNNVCHELNSLLHGDYYVVPEKSLQRQHSENAYALGVSIRLIPERHYPGQAVTRIELLFPDVKVNGSQQQQYREQRIHTLQSGVVLIEIDLIHELPPILPAIPSYLDQEANASPYAIFVSNPRPTLSQGSVHVYQAGVLDHLPTVPIPLTGSDDILLNFDNVYHETFRASRLFSMLVDYEQLPVNVDRYSPADQQRIKALMDEIARSAE